MHYKYEIEIEKPIDFVIKMFDNPDNLKEWQPGLLSFKRLREKPANRELSLFLNIKWGKGKLR